MEWSGVRFGSTGRPVSSDPNAERTGGLGRPGRSCDHRARRATRCRIGNAGAPIGRVTDGTALTLTQDGDSTLFWDHAAQPYLDLGADHA